MQAINGIKIFKINDCDWFAAKTLELAIECAKSEFDYTENGIEDPCELTDEDVDRLQFYLTDDDDNPVKTVSFRDALVIKIAQGETFPYIFASTEQ